MFVENSLLKACYFIRCRRTPLHCAAYGGYVNCMSVLLENSALYNAQDNGVIAVQ